MCIIRTPIKEKPSFLLCFGGDRLILRPPFFNLPLHLKDIFMDKIYLTQKEFDDLPEYSMTFPTGPSEGREIKRHVFFFTITGKKLQWYMVPEGATGISDKWYYYKYVKDPEKPGYLMARPQEIIIAGKLDIDKKISRFMERGNEIVHRYSKPLDCEGIKPDSLKGKSDVRF